MSDAGLNPVPPNLDAGAMDGLPAGPAAALAAAALPTAGQMLNNARRAAGLSLEDLAARVKVPVARLQALEERLGGNQS